MFHIRIKLVLAALVVTFIGVGCGKKDEPKPQAAAPPPPAAAVAPAPAPSATAPATAPQLAAAPAPAQPAAPAQNVMASQEYKPNAPPPAGVAAGESIIAQSEPRIGMTAEEVRAMWGEPTDTLWEEPGVGDRSEVWSYGNSRSVRFVKNRVSAIEK